MITEEQKAALECLDFMVKHSEDHPAFKEADRIIRAALQPMGDKMMTDEQIKHMRDRFLGWKIPDDFYPDGGISFQKTLGNHTYEPSGTNIFDAKQAEAMIRYMLEGLK